MKRKNKKFEKVIMMILSIIIIIIGTYFSDETGSATASTEEANKLYYNILEVPEYSGQAYICINNDIPEFTEEDMNLKDDYYSELKDGKIRNGNDKNKLE